MKTADEILKQVNDFLDNLAYDRKPESLYAPIRYVLSMGGKRIRPVLMLLGYNMFKDNPESILMPACARTSCPRSTAAPPASSSTTTARMSRQSQRS